jgi:hypothetical protein
MVDPVWSGDHAALRSRGHRNTKLFLILIKKALTGNG